jgi:hypothetical protein
MTKSKALLAVFATLISVSGIVTFGAFRFAAAVQPDLINWSKEHKEAVAKMTEQYGAPDEFTQSMVIWYNRGPWKRIVVYKEDVEHDFPGKHHDFLRQWINYKAPVNKFSDAAAFDGSIILERTRGEISVIGESEPMNYLALNLVNEVFSGRKSVKEAREFFAKAEMDNKLGIKSDYTQKLLFSPKSNTADSDAGILSLK